MDAPPCTTPSGQPTILEQHGYRCRKYLGHGSYAVVELAYSKKHSCDVAIKCIAKKKCPDDYIEKFLPREIDVMRLLKHPNLVIFLQSIETNMRVYVVMECASGGDLLGAVTKESQIPEKQAAIWFGHIMEGMKYCHDMGVVHRDMKCENVMLNNKREKIAKIIDFGFARKGMTPGSDGKYELSQTYCGSFAYAAPEILTGTPYVSQLADIWSCGVILFVLVYGRLPFDDTDHRKLIEEVLAGVEWPDEDVNVIPSTGCKDLINKILMPAPDNRLSIEDIQTHPYFLSHCKVK